MPTGGFCGYVRLFLCREERKRRRRKNGGEKRASSEFFCSGRSQAEVAASGEVDLFDNHNGILLNLTTAYVSQ